MKRKMFIMLAMLLTIGSMAACSKKEKEPEPAVVEETEEPAPEPVEEEPEEVIPEFLVELGRDIQKSHKSFEEWLPENKDRFLELVREFEGAAKLIR